ncbi:MAG: hypothetical protein H6719_34280 [Sandaracinaceae bacterium]|nr:hypothetical protein [Sandaracinaceae bacterium]
MEWLSAQLGLRLDAFRRHPGFVDGAAARDHIESYLATIHERGEVHVLERSGRVEAVIAWRYDDDSWFGPAVHTLTLDHRIGADVEPWLRDTLAEVLPRLDAPLDIMIDAAYAPAYRALTGLGLRVDSVQLVGDVEVAFRRLDPGVVPAGVRIDRMVADDLEPIMALYEQTFAAEPEYCWFGGHPRFLERQRERLEAALAKEAHLELVVRADGGVRAHASATVNPDNPVWGPTSGMSLCFAPEMRGRGLLRPVYRRLLEGMREQGAVIFKGGTSQPAVMKLGREMKRTLQGVNLRRGAPFDEAHFAPYLPLRAP